MKPNIQKIIYATDLSLNSTYALSYAMKMAINNNAQIVSLHVIDEVSSNIPISAGELSYQRTDNQVF
jgi:hypothetical protein